MEEESCHEVETADAAASGASLVCCRRIGPDQSTTPMASFPGTDKGPLMLTAKANRRRTPTALHEPAKVSRPTSVSPNAVHHRRSTRLTDRSRPSKPSITRVAEVDGHKSSDSNMLRLWLDVDCPTHFSLQDGLNSRVRKEL
jgi:hypothetical protein